MILRLVVDVANLAFLDRMHVLDAHTKVPLGQLEGIVGGSQVVHGQHE